ncbi:hypothetical protein TrLO_g6465 [Triparma laevis f. longispina]|nr:hypothetical protein TrLO_g6465 [Triparma laevis f. longispina]
MNEISAIFNASKSCEDICEHYGIDNSDGKWSKELRAEVFHLDSSMDEVVMAKFGPPKGFPRAREKMVQGKILRDLNRVTFDFEDLTSNKKYNIYGLKNKCLQETFKEPPNLHMNLEIKDGWLGEVQMLFRDILLIKNELHKFYNVNRADGPFVVAGRLFKSLASPDSNHPNDFEDHKNDANVNAGSKIKSLLKVVKAKDVELEAKNLEITNLKVQLEKANAEKPPDPPKIMLKILKRISSKKM